MTAAAIDGFRKILFLKFNNNLIIKFLQLI